MDNCDRFMMLCILYDMANQKDNKAKPCCKTTQADNTLKPKQPKSELPCVHKNNNKSHKPVAMMYKSKR